MPRARLRQTGTQRLVFAFPSGLITTHVVLKLILQSFEGPHRMAPHAPCCHPPPGISTRHASPSAGMLLHSPTPRSVPASAAERAIHVGAGNILVGSICGLSASSIENQRRDAAGLLDDCRLLALAGIDDSQDWLESNVHKLPAAWASACTLCPSCNDTTQWDCAHVRRKSLRPKCTFGPWPDEQICWAPCKQIVAHCAMDGWKHTYQHTHTKKKKTTVAERAVMESVSMIKGRGLACS